MRLRSRSSNERKRRHQNFLFDSSSPSSSLSSLLTSLELVQGPVGQGRAELHACESWRRAMRRGAKEKGREKSVWRCFAFRLESEERNDARVRNAAGERKKKERLFATAFTLLPLLRFPNTLLSVHRFCPASKQRRKKKGEKEPRECASRPSTHRRCRSSVAARTRPASNCNPFSLPLETE